MHIGVYGTGYLGTVVSACLADFGLPVTCYDRDEVRIARLHQGQLPFCEKNLTDMVRRNTRVGRLTYTTELAHFTNRADVFYISPDSHRQIDEAAMEVAGGARARSIMVIATPVPVGTAVRVEQCLRDLGHDLQVVAQPMFLTDGCAVEDFNWPDRIVLGTTSNDAVFTLKQIYRPLIMRGVPVIVTNPSTAELVREAATAYLATKVAFINEIASLCEGVQADAVDLALALGLDRKIAPRCLQPGTAFGGPFVETQMDSLAQLAVRHGQGLKVLAAAREVNASISDRMADKITSLLQNVPGKEVGILGLAFKPHTNSVAQSSAVQLARRLTARGAHVRAYDPVAIPEARQELNGTVKYCETPYAAAEGSDALVVGTGWPEFRDLDFDRIKRTLKRPLIVDTKNLLDSTRLRAMGFEYVGVGRS
ncbi:MAG TPA: nucleotide sugar dehydrogenase [Terriglobales bacterium]|nr:nucleotide sugar dehydrogenase [Terriglobales bacterium]